MQIDDGKVRRNVLVRRGDDGLMLDQRRFLAELAVEPDWKLVCERLKIPTKTFKGWCGKDEAFRAALDELHRGGIEAGKQVLDSLLLRAAEVHGEALDASQTKHVNTTCPECGTKFDVTAEYPNFQVALRAAENILKRAGELVDLHKHEGSIGHVLLSIEQQIALLAYRRDPTRISASMAQELRALGVLPEGRQDPKESPIDAEYRVLDEDSED